MNPRRHANSLVARALVAGLLLFGSGGFGVAVAAAEDDGAAGDDPTTTTAIATTTTLDPDDGGDTPPTTTPATTTPVDGGEGEGGDDHVSEPGGSDHENSGPGSGQNQLATTTTVATAANEQAPLSPRDTTPAPEDRSRDDRQEATPNPLLVAGPSDGRRQIGSGPEGAEPVAEAEGDTADELQGSEQAPVVTDDAEVKVRRIVWGLIGLAVVLTLLAVYYWWITRPERPAVAEHEAGRTGDSDSEGTVDSWLTDSTSTR